MKRATESKELQPLLQALAAAGEGAPGDAEKVRLVRAFRDRAGENHVAIDEFFVREMSRLRAGLLQAQAAQEQLKKRLERLAAPPWHPAVFLGREETGRGAAAMVCHGGARRIVPFDTEFEEDGLAIGDEVLLGPELNVVVARSPYRPRQGGETAVFQRLTEDGRLVLKWRDEEIVVDAAGTMARADLRHGDLVRWERALWLAFEKINRPQGDHLFLEETPAETFDEVGGLETQIAGLKGLVRIHLERPDLARRYRLRRRGAVLLTGPPGTGKTMLARAFANWLSRLSPSGRSRFVNIKPGSLHSVWYSETERNYREVFRMAREAAMQEPEIPVVLFFDEIDAIGRARSESMTRIDDRVLPAFMTELNGLEERGNVLVIAATNRADALDPALLRGQGRLGDLHLEVPRPNRDAARAIFSRHLHEDVPYATEGQHGDGGTARAALIDAATARIYAPNGMSRLATITFRDGRQLALKASDFVSGASIAKISKDATERACVRDIETGEPGVRLEDLLWAIEEEFDRAARVLTPLNCRTHLGDLPQDADIASIEPARRPAARAHR